MDTLVTTHFMKESTQTQDFDGARASLFKMGIKTSYDENRVIFSAEHNFKSCPSVYTQECNGLILEKNTWKPLMVPPRSLRFNFNTETVNKFLHQGIYHIYQADDGTCFNMYFYNDKWCISTAKGYEMNDVKWDNSTYQQLITECLAGVGLTWDEFIALLDIKKCYSFGFKHPKFHYFQRVHKVWFIQSVCLDEASPSYLWAQDTWNDARITKQIVHENHVNDIHELHRIAHNAIHEYIDLKNASCYGFILRSVNSELTGTHSDLFIESSLMKTIRRLCYDNKLMNLCHANQWSKEDTITLSAFLNAQNYDIFMHLFPQYKSKFEHYHTMISGIVSDMIKIINKHKVDSPYASVATQLLTAFKLKVKYDIYSKTQTQKTRVLTEFITNADYMHMFKNF